MQIYSFSWWSASASGLSFGIVSGLSQYWQWGISLNKLLSIHRFLREVINDLSQVKSRVDQECISAKQE